jgi:hypothetical protein
MRLPHPSLVSARLWGALGVLGLATILGCAGNSDGDDYPMRPGNGGGIGGGGGGSGGVDAGPDGRLGDGALAIGRVCLITDLRFPTSCAGSLGGATVQVQRGTATITPGADGKFTLPAGSTVGDRWLVTGTNMVTSVVPFSPGAPVLLPLVAQPTWDAMRLGSDIPQLAGLGALHISSRRPNGLPKPNVTVTADPAGTSVPFYAGTSANVWGNTPGTSGVAILPNLTADQAVDIVGQADVRATLLQQPVAADSITFLGLDFLQ